ncbi:MAG: alpha/beta hydrolase [Alphaproteobacteria bacterium]|jgi:acetyl esterase|nr:alpha/beta hydrolase [Alphaproteobacteria bacterium]MDP6515666.1 alpha/beta hydrolase [Alphaproteobacteria bacterium]
MDLHPQMRALLDELEAADFPDQTKVPLAEARAITDERAKRHYGPPEPVESVFETTIPGADGRLAARVYRPRGDRPRAGRPLPVLVYFHGGGWVLGSLDSHDRGVRALSNAAGCMSVSVAYRLAPEHPFPAPAEDCFAALGWLAENAGQLGGDGSRIAVGGDSAGGNLAAVAALMARQAGAPKLAFQLLIYPVLDSALDTPSYREHAEAPMLTHERMAFFWDKYVPDPAARGDWRAAPLQAGDLEGLPPTLIVSSGIDPLCSEGGAYAARLEQAGVPVERLVFPRMCHAFFQAPALLDDSREAIAHAGRVLAEAFATP